VVPNGTGFALTVGPAPELDGKYLIVGRIVDGQQVVQDLSELPVVKDNSNSPFFKAGKALGDKRAIVAEQGFNRPFNKVVVASSGLL
jgi:peptidyl-prolyl cis-trans isomerase B (cyclophilin B)